MATLIRARARKPLAIGRPQFSYGSRFDVNEGKRGVTVYVVTDEESPRYTLHLTDEEIDRLVATRDAFKKEFDE